MTERARCAGCDCSLPYASATIVDGKTYHDSCAPEPDIRSVTDWLGGVVGRSRDRPSCPACGEAVINGDVPLGYDTKHCHECAAGIARRGARGVHCDDARDAPTDAWADSVARCRECVVDPTSHTVELCTLHRIDRDHLLDRGGGV
jgi:hypothetical protein